MVFENLRNKFSKRQEKEYSQDEKVEIERQTIKEEIAARRRHADDLETNIDSIEKSRASHAFSKARVENYPDKLEDRMDVEQLELRREIETWRNAANDLEQRFEEVAVSRAQGPKSYSKRNRLGPYKTT